MSDVPSVRIPEGLVYLDNNATTARAPEVVAAMEPYWGAAFGNAESAHFAGRLARRARNDPPGDGARFRPAREQ